MLNNKWKLWRFFDWVPDRDIAGKSLPLEKSERCPSLNIHQYYGEVRSKHLGQLTTAHFRNDSGNKIALFFISDVGETILVATLGNGESVSLDTMEGHVFIAADMGSGKLLLRHTVGMFYFGASLQGDCVDEEFSEMLHYSGPPLECGFISKGLVNLSKCKLNIFYFNGVNEELITQLEPFYAESSHPTHFASRQHYEAIYLTHQFFARLPNGKLVEEKKVDRIIIPSCNEETLEPRIGESLTAPPVQLTFPSVVREASSCGSDLDSLQNYCTDPLRLPTSILSNVNVTDSIGQPYYLPVYIPPPVLDVKNYLVSQSAWMAIAGTELRVKNSRWSWIQTSIDQALCSLVVCCNTLTSSESRVMSSRAVLLQLCSTIWSAYRVPVCFYMYCVCAVYFICVHCAKSEKKFQLGFRVGLRVTETKTTIWL